MSRIAQFYGVKMTNERKKELLAIARKSIAGENPRTTDKGERYGAFVTLRKHGALRGCIGFLEPIADLEKEIAELAREAAFSDPRFPPLSLPELPECTIEISLLTKPERIGSLDEFRLHRDGIILSLHGRRAVFLPQVADETGWTEEEMLSALSEKAGLPMTAWKSDEAVFHTFQAEVFSEDEM